MLGAFGFMFAIEKTKNSAAGVPVLLGFTFFMGLMLSRLIAMVLGFKNGSELVMTAFGLAVAIPAVLAYNVFGRVIGRVEAELEGFAHDLLGSFGEAPAAVPAPPPPARPMPV